jgi:Domain of unknown function (DUF4034)
VILRCFAVLTFTVGLLTNPARSVAADTPVVDDVAPFKAALVQKLDDRQFAELETIERELLSTKVRFAGGDWKVFHFYEALSAAHVIEDAPIESDWVNLIASLKDWHKRSPAAPVAPLLLADAYTSYAWYARGTGRADTVKEAMWGFFKDRLNQAAFYLNASRRRSGNANPQWHTTAFTIARGLSWPRDRAEALAKEAATVEPLYQHAYSAMAIYLSPRWSGQPGDWERFALETADRIGGLEGSAVYNHIALRVSSNYGNAEFFEENDVNWRKLQWGFADREKLYGTGIQSLNAMCRLAHGIHDLEAGRAFLKRIGDSWDQSVWRTRQNFDLVKRAIEEG